MRVLVLGDAMLDVYKTVIPTKLSQEAPVVVGLFDSDTFVPGGAANAAANCVALGAEAILVSYLGNDNTGKCLKTVLADFGVLNACVTPANWDTIRKERIVDPQFRQLCRVDYEVADPLTKKASTSALRSRLRKFVDECDCLFIYDYAKGTCNWILEYSIKLFKSKDKFVVVNGKPEHVRKYRGADLVTMNESEWRESYLKEFANPEPIDYPEQILHRMRILFNGGHVDPLKFTTLAMTRGSKGMFILRPKALTVENYRAEKVNVADVSGAGDTVASVFAIRASSDPETCHDAMKMAAQVVQFNGTAVPNARSLG